MAQASQKQAQTNGVSDILEEGIDLYRQIRDMNDRLSEIKDTLRQYADDVRNGEKTVNLKTEDGEHTVSVTFPSASLRVQRKADMDAIREEVGDLLFDIFFNTKVSYSPSSDFEENVEKVKDPLQKQALESVVDKKESTPRVKFPK